MRQTRRNVLAISLLLIVIVLTGCVASSLDQAKLQYEKALLAEYPLPYYKAALEELDAVLSRDPNNYQAYAIKGIIYRNLQDFEQASKNLDIAKQGTFGARELWVPTLVNLTYGDIFHGRASEAARSGDWTQAKSYQETSIEFFNNVITSSFQNMDVASTGDTYGASMRSLYVSAQIRWAAAKFQMAAIASKLESKQRQEEILREVTTRLTSVLEAFPDATSLRYYLAEGYRKQALTIRQTDPAESTRLQEMAMSQLRACGEMKLPRELQNQAAQLFNVLSKGAEPEIEQKILGASATSESETAE